MDVFVLEGDAPVFNLTNTLIGPEWKHSRLDQLAEVREGKTRVYQQAKVGFYTVWPNMPAGKVPPDDQLPPWTVEMRQRSGNLRAAEFPDRDAFDCAAQWSKPYQGDFDKPWVGNICRTDVQHIRAGLPAYAIAALFFAAIFEEKPDTLDFRIYNDPQQYGEDPHHDRGEVFPITSDLAKVVHETIWEVLEKVALGKSP